MPKTRRLKKWVRDIASNILLLIIFTFISIFLLEVILRLFNPMAEMNAVYDSELHHVFIANASHIQRNPNLIGEFYIKGKLNSYGFNDVEHNLEKSDNIIRIVVLGDSFMMCQGTHLETCYSRLLEKNLNENCSFAKKIEVINLGVNGYSISNEYLLFNRIGKNFTPDLVILGLIFGADFSDYKSVEIADNGDLVFIPYEKPKLYGIRSFLSRKSHAYQIFFVLKQVILHNKKSNKQDVYSFTEDHNIGKEIELFKGVFLQFKKDLKSGNIPLVTLVIPLREEVDEEMKQRFIKYSGVFAYHDLRPEMMEFFNSNSELVIDPLNYLRERNQNNSFYYNIDGHWNSQGHINAVQYSAPLICDLLKSI